MVVPMGKCELENIYFIISKYVAKEGRGGGHM